MSRRVPEVVKVESWADAYGQWHVAVTQRGGDSMAAARRVGRARMMQEFTDRAPRDTRPTLRMEQEPLKHHYGSDVVYTFKESTR